jgi:hyperosmotically inducible periplasmic protein
MNRQTMTMSAVSVLLASLALAGCDKRDDTQAARTNDTAVVQGQPTAGEQAQRGAEQVADASKQAANDVANATKGAADQASNKVADAVITTSVNAELAKDPQLSSLRIDVDTDAGRVALKGTAPDAASKQRAAQLASSVKGVVSVDNQLQVGKG